MRRICAALSAALLAAAPAFSAETNAPPTRLPSILEEMIAKERDDNGSPFSLRFKELFEERILSGFRHRFDRFKIARAYLLHDRDPYAVSEGFGKNGFRRVIHAGIHSLEEIAIDSAPAEYLKDIPGNFILNSIGGTDEEDIDPLSLDYSVPEKGLWKRLARSERLSYGIRPWRLDPYAFMSIRLSNPIVRRERAYLHLRYHYERFEDHKMEGILLLPLSRSWMFRAGATYQPEREDDPDRSDFEYSARIQRTFGYGSGFFLGTSVRKHASIFAGYAKDF